MFLYSALQGWGALHHGYHAWGRIEEQVIANQKYIDYLCYDPVAVIETQKYEECDYSRRMVKRDPFWEAVSETLEGMKWCSDPIDPHSEDEPGHTHGYKPSGLCYYFPIILLSVSALVVLSVIIFGLCKCCCCR